MRIVYLIAGGNCILPQAIIAASENHASDILKSTMPPIAMHGCWMRFYDPHVDE
jgi:hypothetical protein